MLRLFQRQARGHLAVNQILTGRVPGLLFVDDSDTPTCGLAWFHSRVYLVGLWKGPEQSAGLSQFFDESLLPLMSAAGTEGFILHANPEPDEKDAQALFPNRKTTYALRHYYELTLKTSPDATELPDGYSFRLVDSGLLENSMMKNLEWLREEMVSEQPSVEAFLEHSFGVALEYEHEVIGWCLAEYRTNDGCEVGVAVAESHQRRGLGVVMTGAFLREAYHQGMRRVGWHCWARNIPSARLACSAGFQLQREFPVIVCFPNTAKE